MTGKGLLSITLEKWQDKHDSGKMDKQYKHGDSQRANADSQEAREKQSIFARDLQIKTTVRSYSKLIRLVKKKKEKKHFLLARIVEVVFS